MNRDTFSLLNVAEYNALFPFFILSLLHILQVYNDLTIIIINANIHNIGIFYVISITVKPIIMTKLIIIYIYYVSGLVIMSFHCQSLCHWMVTSYRHYL